MSLKSFMKNRIGRFFRDRAGNVAILFGIAILPLTIAVGAAIDYSNSLNVKAKLQGALDSGVLKVGSDPTLVVGGSPACTTSIACASEIESAVRNATRAYFSTYMGQTPQVSVKAAADLIYARATLTLPTNFMRIVGKSDVNIVVTSEAKRGAMGGSEVALVLDTTGSMASPKIDALKTAASQLVTALLPAGSANRVSIVPFDMYVNVGLANRNATWLTGSNDYTLPGPTSCTTTWSIATPGTPVWVPGTCGADGMTYDCSYWNTPITYSGTSTTTCVPTTLTYTWQGCVGSRAYPLDLSDSASALSPVTALMNTYCTGPLTRLTNNAASLQSAINALSPASETYIAPGVLWGWRTLSPNPPFADGAAYGASNKALVLMTDGANTHSASYPAHANFDVADANNVTVATCAAVKAAGVKVYVVAFMVTDPGIVSVLQNCASAPINYYTATSVPDLLTAFQAIGAQITKVRLSR